MSRAGYIVNEDWSLPQAGFILPQTGLISQYDNWSEFGLPEQDAPLILDNRTTTYVDHNEQGGVAAITFSFDFNEKQYVNSVAFVAEGVDTFLLQAGDGVGLLEPIVSEQIGNGSSKLFVFEKMGARFFNIAFNGSDYLRVYQVSLGQAIQLPSVVWEGFQHPKWRNDDEIIAYQTNSPTGSTRIDRMSDCNLHFGHIPTNWFRKNWQPVAVQNKALPMWFAWDLKNDPDGVIYGGWQYQQPPNYRTAYLTELRLRVRGIL